MTVHLTAKGHATRARIILAASVLIYERGVAGAGLEEIQSAAGVSASQLYHYFAGKTDLVRAVIAHQRTAVLSRHRSMLSTVDSVDSLRAWLSSIVDATLAAQCLGGCPLGSLASELSDSVESARADLAAAFDEWHALIEAALRTPGLLRSSVDFSGLAWATLAAIQGGLLMSQACRSIEPLRAALAAAVDHIESVGVSRD